MIRLSVQGMHLVCMLLVCMLLRLNLRTLSPRRPRRYTKETIGARRLRDCGGSRPGAVLEFLWAAKENGRADFPVAGPSIDVFALFERPLRGRKHISLTGYPHV